MHHGSEVGGYLLRKRDVIPWTSWMTSPWRTGRGGEPTTSSCLWTRDRLAAQMGTRPNTPGTNGDSPVRVLNDPPVVDVFERVTGDLLLVRAAPPIFIPEQEVLLVRLQMGALSLDAVSTRPGST